MSQALAWCNGFDEVCDCSAGELSTEEIDKIVAVIQNPLQFMPSWFVNRKKDIKDGKTTHVYANLLDTKMRDSLERLWKIR